MKNTNDFVIAIMAMLALLSTMTLVLFTWNTYNDREYPLVIDRREEQLAIPKGQSIPKKEEQNKENIKEENNRESSYSFPMDINKADKEALMQVNGIGEKRAEQIIAYRTSHNGIKNMRELLEIKGIGEVTLQRLEEKFYAGT